MIDGKACTIGFDAVPHPGSPVPNDGKVGHKGRKVDEMFGDGASHER